MDNKRITNKQLQEELKKLNKKFKTMEEARDATKNRSKRHKLRKRQRIGEDQ